MADDGLAVDYPFLGTLKVLFVEDGDLAREALAYYLRRRFKAVDVAGNGRDGLAMFKANHYDVVLTDIIMPVMDGLDMSRQIKAIDAKVPILILTAHSDAHHVSLAKEIGVASLIKKPVYPELVVEEIFKCLAPMS